MASADYESELDRKLRFDNDERMTVNDYISHKFQTFGINLSEADLLEISLSSAWAPIMSFASASILSNELLKTYAFIVPVPELRGEISRELPMEVKAAMESELEVSQKTTALGIMLPSLSLTVASMVFDFSSIEIRRIEEESVMEPG